MKQWIALYTKPRSERLVVSKLESLNIACFYPQRQAIRQWSDRKKKVLIPLIPSYVFVNIELRNCHRVFESEAVVRVVTFNKRAAIVRLEEIALLRLACNDEEIQITSDNRSRVGEKAEIIEGIFTGYSGVIVGLRGSSAIAIQIEELGLSVIVSVAKVQVRLKEAV